MSVMQEPKHRVAVVGAGPAGLFAARALSQQGVQVALFNRDLKPGGLAEYGIYPTKYKMKEGLRAQFRQILSDPLVSYYGNVIVGEEGDLRLADLHALGFQALLITVGAQATKWLGLPGEDLQGVYHAKDLVYHYNHLPLFADRCFLIGQRVAVVGVGNVMTDIAHYLISELRVMEVIAIARRGPAEVKFDKKELEHIIANLDLSAFDEEVERVAEVMRSLGQDPKAAREFVHSVSGKALACDSPTRLRILFLESPERILGDENGRVCGIVLQDNTLERVEGEVRARPLGKFHTLEVDTVIFAIGDRVDSGLGLPVRNGEFIKNSTPRFPVEGLSYEVEAPFDGVFVAGWARKSSAGLVGVARKDGEQGAKAVLQYLAGRPEQSAGLDEVEVALERLGKPIVRLPDLLRLDEAERIEGQRRGVEHFQFERNEEMLRVMGLA
jgi:ferredoxin--NADP+ reductase